MWLHFDDICPWPLVLRAISLFLDWGTLTQHPQCETPNCRTPNSVRTSPHFSNRWCAAAVIVENSLREMSYRIGVIVSYITMIKMRHKKMKTWTQSWMKVSVGRRRIGWHLSDMPTTIYLLKHKIRLNSTDLVYSKPHKLPLQLVERKRTVYQSIHNIRPTKSSALNGWHRHFDPFTCSPTSFQLSPA